MLCDFALRPSSMKTVDVSLGRLGSCCPWDLHRTLDSTSQRTSPARKFGNA